MGGQNSEAPGEEADGVDHAEPADASDEETTPAATRPLIDASFLGVPRAFPPLIDPAFFGGLNPLKAQAAEIARAVAPVAQSLNLQIAESIALAWPKLDLTPLLPIVDVTQWLPKIGGCPEFRGTSVTGP